MCQRAGMYDHEIYVQHSNDIIFFMLLTNKLSRKTVRCMRLIIINDSVILRGYPMKTRQTIRNDYFFAWQQPSIIGRRLQ